MQLTAQSEWMDDQKQAVVMSPADDFQVVQSTACSSVFFSIGTDRILYVTREGSESKTGWTKLDLSSKLSQNHSRAKVVVKSFAVAQSSSNLSIEIALVVTIGQSDYLYMTGHIKNDDELWGGSEAWNSLEWRKIAFDADSRNPDSLEIASVRFEILPVNNQTCFVDVLKGYNTSNRMRLIDRYFVRPSKTPHWTMRTVPVELRANEIKSCIGRRHKDRVGGTYTLGYIEARTQLIFQMAYNPYRPDTPASPVRLEPPTGSTAIASAFNSDGFSSLFISARDGVYVWDPKDQSEGSRPRQILKGSLVADASQLSAQTQGKITALYGTSPNKDLFYCTCPAGSEAEAKKWSEPMRLVSNIERYSFFVNKTAANNTVFAQAGGQSIIQLTQDPITTDWASRSILLPSTNMKDVLTFSTFTTRIKLEGDFEKSNITNEVELTATSPVGVYVNNRYRVLHPHKPLSVQPNANRVIKIIQPTQDSVAICYKARLVKHPNVVIDIDPAAKANDKLNKLRTVSDLENAKITMDDGSTLPLVPEGVSEDDKDAAVEALKQMMRIRGELPQNGSCGDTHNRVFDKLGSNLMQLTPKANGGIDYMPDAIPNLSCIPIQVSSGDLFHSLLAFAESAWKGIKRVFFQIVDSVHKVIVQIGDVIYEALLNTIAAVNHAIEWVFTKIKVGIDKLKNWLGFMFNWPDVLQTQKVIKNVMKVYALNGLKQIGDLQTTINKSFDSLEEQIAKWANVKYEKSANSMSNDSKKKSSAADDPQTHYIHDKAEENLDETKDETPSKAGQKGLLDNLDKAVKDAKDLGALLNTRKSKHPGKKGTVVKSTDSKSTAPKSKESKSKDSKDKDSEDKDSDGDSSKEKAAVALTKLASETKDKVVDTIMKMVNQIFEGFGKLSIGDICKQLAGLLGMFVVNTAKNVLSSTLQLVKDIGEAIIEGLEEEIKIPILSWLYEELTGDKLSILSLVALAAALPATLIYKAVVGSVPFDKKSPVTKKLVDAKDFSTIQSILSSNPQTMRNFTIVSEFIAMGGLLFDVICNLFKTPQMLASKPHLVTETMRKVSIPVKLLVLMPKIIRPRKDIWYDRMDAVVTDIAVAKCLLEATEIGGNEIYGNISPYVDFAISTCFVVTGVAQLIDVPDGNASHYTLFTTDLAYSLAVMTAPIIWYPAMEPSTKGWILAGSSVVVGIAAVVRLGTGALLKDELKAIEEAVK